MNLLADFSAETEINIFSESLPPIDLKSHGGALLSRSLKGPEEGSKFYTSFRAILRHSLLRSYSLSFMLRDLIFGMYSSNMMSLKGPAQKMRSLSIKLSE